MTAGICVSIFFPEGNLWLIVSGSLLLIWLTVLVCSLNLNQCLQYSRFGSLVKIALVAVLHTLSVRYVYLNGFANTFSVATLIPSAGNIYDGLKFLPAMVFNLIGFELATSLTRECPVLRKKLRWMLVGSVLVVSVFYLSGVLSLLFVIPFQDVGLLSELMEVFRQVLPSGWDSQMAIFLIYLLLLFTLLTDGISWSAGACRVIQDAAENGGMPECFARTTAGGAPVGASVLSGLLASVVVLIYALFAQSGEELFWEVFSFGLLIILLPYILVFLPYVRLMLPARKNWRDRFKKIMAAYSALGFILWAIALILAPTGSLAELWQWDSLLALAGVALVFGYIEIHLVRRA